MNNVISFPRPAAKAPQTVRTNGAKTLFIHIRNTTLIAHLACAGKATAAAGRVGKSQ